MSLRKKCSLPHGLFLPRKEQEAMKQIRLDNYHEYVVSDDAYQQIVAIVETSEVCKGCSKPFTKENPKVAEHTCLSCLLKREANKHLRFVGLVSATQYGDTSSLVDPK